MESIVIFGGSGFIGTHLSKALLGQGEHVIVVDLQPPRFIHEYLDYIHGDVRDLSKLDINQSINRIYNFAAIHTTPGHRSYEYYETNIAGANQVCKFAEENNVHEIIFTSSISVYGPDEDKKDERTQLTPNSSYGYSKMLAEQIHKAWVDRNPGRILSIVRPAVVFGPGEGGNFTRLATMLQKGFFVYPGRKDTIKACIYVDDLLFLINEARNSSNRFELFNGAYPEMYTLEDIVMTFKRDHFNKVKVFTVPKFVVLGAAKFFQIFNVFNVGIHPDRVMKLIRSTNIYPSWLDDNNVRLPGNIESALKRWSQETDGKFN
ncbi:NAD(P)-dependent oxidoreductase [Neptuniibacter sp. UBA6509]|uniref:NAD-dependent epimerase/dehydratase family protein n=1 Tax=Neptuniibacter sp. UBA6509 TaxID=1946976 RepID=UPI0025D86505|nr:NAD(P)-dependent oxidoreductase [Neptuniibacter sp. UBA6509]|tara:strand:- start:1820 stop:2776 length:957 start_codon:yes stop_codon:yes gene_type:complete